ncbi:SRPBCC family protein [Lacibacter sediminis]|nr:SRPBCC domain-containing protein [Lacibacter sediminis]
MMRKTTIRLLFMIILAACKNDRQQKHLIHQKNTTMATNDFTATIVVDQTPEQVFNAVNHVRGWWSEEIEGNTDKLNAVFDYHYEDVHRCKMEIIEFIPNRKVVWLVHENYFRFTNDKTEWTGTKIVFDIDEKEGKTQLRFTHLGLVPEYECFQVCRDAWTTYVTKSLHSLITTGKGQPNGKDKPQTENEKKLSAAKG